MAEENNVKKSRTLKEKWQKFNTDIFFSHEISGVSSLSMKRIMRGRFSKIWNYIGRSIAYSSASAYGCFTLTFGLLTLFLHLGEYYFMSEPDVELSSLIIGAVLVVISIPLLLVKKPMCLVFQDIALTDYIFFEFFSITRMPKMNTDLTPISPLAALFIGFIPAIIGFFLPTHYVVIVLVLMFLSVIAFMSPEFPMILTLLVLPYCYFLKDNELVLAVLSLFTLLVYARKVLLGKRVYNFRINDIILFLMIAFIIISGALGDSEDSLIHSLKLCAVMLSYIPCANLIVNRRLADCAVHSVIVSSVPVAVLAVIEFIAEHPKTGFAPPVASTPGTSSLFASPETLAAFLLISGLFSFSFAIQKKKKAIKAIYTLIALINALSLVLTMQPAAWISAVLAIGAYFIIKSHKIKADILFFVVVAVHLVLFVPMEFFDALVSKLGVSKLPSEYTSGLLKSFEIFKENVIFGVGPAESSIGAESGNLNLILGMAATVGIIVASLFILMMIIRFRQIAFFRAYFSTSLVKTTGRMAFVAIFSILIFGVGANIFLDKAMVYLFYATMGIGNAILLRAKKESEDRMEYYGDSSRSDLSMLDIGLK